MVDEPFAGNTVSTTFARVRGLKNRVEEVKREIEGLDGEPPAEAETVLGNMSHELHCLEMNILHEMEE